MIEKIGVGIDIINVSRFRNMPFEKKSSFYKKIFHDNEINYCLKFKDPYTHFAGKFALKEALIKSIDKKIFPSEIETSHLNSKPIINISKNTQDYKFIASLSHENEFAIAVILSVKN
jgi:holo-[acyl-carrier protein] synthase